MVVTFLLGAGVSIPAGLPSTTQLTELILHDDGFRLRGGRFIPVKVEAHDRHFVGNRDPVERIQAYLRMLRKEIACRLSVREDEVNYEQICDLAWRIYRQVSGEDQDPILLPFVRSILPDLPGDTCSPLDPFTYICEALCVFLRPSEGDLSYLRLFREAALDPEFDLLRIFTLNHDEVLETYCEREGLSYYDGLGALDGSLRWLDLAGYAGRSEKVHIWKLHGSRRWAYIEPEDMSGGVRVARLESQFVKNAAGRAFRTLNHPQVLQVGTLSKAGNYMWDPFNELLNGFRKALEDTRTLVVVGHSFGDRAMLALLVYWLSGAPDRRVLVVDPQAEQLRGKLQSRAHGDRFDLWQAGVEDVAWEQLRARVG
jgi:hypothetical protein